MKPMEVKLRSKMSHWPKISHRYDTLAKFLKKNLQPKSAESSHSFFNVFKTCYKSLDVVFFLLNRLCQENVNVWNPGLEMFWIYALIRRVYNLQIIERVQSFPYFYLKQTSTMRSNVMITDNLSWAQKK